MKDGSLGKSNIIQSRMTRIAQKIPTLRKVTVGKFYFKGLRITVQKSSKNAYFLELFHNRLNLTMYQVIDNDRSGLYPIKNSDLEALNVYRCNGFDEANIEFEKRK